MIGAEFWAAVSPKHPTSAWVIQQLRKAFPYDSLPGYLIFDHWIGNCRRDLIDHEIVVNERHLRRLMNEYVRYYHQDRTHLALEKRTPAGRHAAKNPDGACRVVSLPRLGGLHHRYDLAAWSQRFGRSE